MEVKIWFSRKPTWFKGAIIATIIIGVSFLLNLATIFTHFPLGLVLGPYIIPFLLITQALASTFGQGNTLLFYESPYSKLGPEPTALNWVIITIIIILIYFLLGAIIGWIVGKLKQRRIYF